MRLGAAWPQGLKPATKSLLQGAALERLSASNAKKQQSNKPGQTEGVTGSHQNWRRGETREARNPGERERGVTGCHRFRRGGTRGRSDRSN